MASAATSRACISLLPISTLEISSSGSSRAHLCSSSRIPGVVRRVSYGGDWDGPIRRRRIEDGLSGVARVRKGENDVDLEEEPLLLRIGVSLVTQIFRVLSNLRSTRNGREHLQRTEVLLLLEGLNFKDPLKALVVLFLLHLKFKEKKDLSELLKAKVMAGYRPLIPDPCPSKLKALIESCWHPDPGARPSFAQIIVDLKNVL